jgi:ABC-type lipoprotein release transport system permease subunit
MKRHLFLLDYTLHSLARRKAANAGLFLLFAFIVFLLASVLLYAQALRAEAARTLSGAPEITIQRMIAGRHDLIPPGYLDRLGPLRGVQNRTLRLWGYYFDPGLKANLTLMAAPPHLAQEVAGQNVLLGAALAEALELRAGATLVFLDAAGEPVSFTVARILPPEADIATADLVLLSEPAFRAFFQYPEGHFTDIALHVANPQEVRRVAAKLSARLPDSRIVLRDDILLTYAAVFSWREGLVLVVLLAAVLAFAIFALDKASGLSADERREIGILKAIGWHSGDVLAMKAWEGALISVSAYLAGYVAAYIHVFHLSAVLFEDVLRGWSVLAPRYRLTPITDPLQLSALFLLTVLPYALATVVPVWRAAVTDPDAVMRGAA